MADQMVRSTREQVDEALHIAESGPVGDGIRRTLAAEVYALRAEANCGQGHDPTRICCARAADVHRLRAEVEAVRTPQAAERTASVDVRMERPTAPDWGGEYADDGRHLYHHAWDSADGMLRLWVGPYTAEQPDPSWAVTVRAEGADVVMRCTPAEVVEWIDEVKATLTLSAVLPPLEPAIPARRTYDQLTEQEGGPPNERLPLYAPAGAEGPKCACEIPTAELSPPCPRHGPIQWPTVPDGEDVPARLDAAADALFSVCDDGALIFSFRDLAERLRDSDGGTPEVRAAVAAALVQPTGAGS